MPEASPVQIEARFCGTLQLEPTHPQEKPFLKSFGLKDCGLQRPLCPYERHTRSCVLFRSPQRSMFTAPLRRILAPEMETQNVHPRSGRPEAALLESRLHLLSVTSQRLAARGSPDALAGIALEAGHQLSGASFGVCTYPVIDADGMSSQSYRATGFTPVLDHVPASRKMPVPSSRHRASTAAAGSPPTDLLMRLLPAPVPLHSLLTVPIPGSHGEPLGHLLYGHPEPDRINPDVEPLVSAIAAQLAVALENIQLTDTLTREMGLVASVRAAQRQTDRRLAQALEAAELGTWTWDAVTGFLDFDERGAALFGVEPHRPVPRDALRERVVYADDLHHSPVDLHDFLRTKGQYSAEYRIDALDGAQRWIYANGRAVLSDVTGEVAGLTGTVQDITERKNQEASLRTSEKLAATGRLAASIAHEINNPLEAVTNLIYLAKTDPATPSGIARLLETADSELARVSQIAQQTLGFYRDTTHPVFINLNHLLEAVVELFDRKLLGKRLHCTLDLEPGLSIVGLQGEIRQVVSNLLVNAIDASPHSGSDIYIRGRHRHRNGHGGVSVVIADRGCGVPRHVQHRLFTPFVTTKQSTGTGLGLWVTRGMVEKHGGSIRFRSRSEAPSGTVFRVYLPKSAHPQLFAAHASEILQ